MKRVRSQYQKFGSTSWMSSVALFGGLLWGRALSVQAQIDPPLALKYFDEAKQISERDGGRLWGVPLYGPMIFAESGSRQVVANQADHEGLLKKQGGVFVGTLPANVGLANTSVKWAGVHWTMVVWPPPADDARARSRLFAHELWHGVQDELGFPAANPSNVHLDTRDGRYWLQLEWRALKAALESSGDARKDAIADALLFRAFRWSLFKSADLEERALEMNEGLANYTGVDVGEATSDDARSRAVAILEDQSGAKTFTRSFAYTSGPAYGVLLDEACPDWRKKLRVKDDLGELLGDAFSLPNSRERFSAVEVRARVYDNGSLRAAEDQRDQKRQGRMREYRRRFVEGPVLTIPLRQMNVDFDPLNWEPLDDIGTVYPTIRISDEWGVLKVKNGALLSADWTWVRVTAPNDLSARPMRGDGWTLELGDGWKIAMDKKEGCFVVTREKKGNSD